jgi:uncharacterized protein (UPF0305 family)
MYYCQRRSVLCTGDLCQTGSARRQEADVDAFTEALIERVQEARAALRGAAESSDTAAMLEALDELESALQVAREHGVEVPPVGDGSSEQVRS